MFGFSIVWLEWEQINFAEAQKVVPSIFGKKS
jgi:hypothetical protein